MVQTPSSRGARALVQGRDPRAALGAAWACACVVASAACARPAPASPPPEPTARGESPSASGDAASPLAPVAVPTPAVPTAATPPVRARLVRTLPHSIEPAVCVRVLVAVARGQVSVAGAVLAEGDVAVLTHPGPAPVPVLGEGLVAVATVDLPACVVLSRPAATTQIVRGAASTPLTWAKGGMTARLDVGPDVSPEAYLGRLEGTAGVPEHVHASSWEVLFAVEGEGTLLLDGAPVRVGPGDVVLVPAGKRHAWTPDPNRRLRAVQMYVPPGPEQRFKALAAGAASPPALKK